MSRKRKMVSVGESLLWVLVCLVLYQMFSLWWWEVCCTVVVGLFLLPVVNRCIRRIHEYKEEYYEVTTYMEQVLCSYKRWGKLRPSLEDCITLYPAESRMGHVLQQASYILKTGEGVEDSSLVETALEQMEQSYPSRRLKLLHEYLAQAEKMGGDTEGSMDILLKDLQMWKGRVIRYQKEKQFIHFESLLYMSMALIFCYLSSLLIPFSMRGMMMATWFYQMSMWAVVLCFLFYGVVFSYRLSGSWLDGKEIYSPRELWRQKRNYHVVKAQKNGISFFLAKRLCQLEVEKEFPYWMLSVILYLQRESAYQAIRMSHQRIDGFFSTEVNQLLEAIYANPVSLQPFLDFFRELEMPEVQTGMKLLYSVNCSGYTETSRQVRFLVEQSNTVMDQWEKRRFDSRLANLSLWKQIPMTVAGIKIVLDMLLFLVQAMKLIL